MEYCVYCGADISPYDEVCPECGAKITIRRPDVFFSFEDDAELTEVDAETTEVDSEITEDKKNVMDTSAVAVADTDDNKVMTPFDYLGSVVLLALPVIGFILSVFWALDGCKNRNRKNLAIGCIYLRIAFLIILTVTYLLMKFLNPDLLYSILSNIENVLFLG